ALEGALDQLVRMRAVEGEKLAADIARRVDAVAALNGQIKARSPFVVDEYRERLSTRMKELLADAALDAGRLATEVALFAERSNITEETVRLESHLVQVRACLNADEPVGRKLDFLIQEMNREINTIASKSGDLAISRAVVEVKSELEKIREQVQNIE
ncbi:MAG: YicC family protein, partial [Firmicutes bacterium]|nr:YicC family protein [Bacillota bacterium]